MQFVDKFEPLVRTVDDVVVSLGLFGSYSEAQDRAILFASEELPQERVIAFQIEHVFVNESVKVEVLNEYANPEEDSKRGDF